MEATSLTSHGAGELLSHGWADAVTLGDLMLRTADSRPAADAVVFPQERLTYGELAERACRFARGLIGLGVQPGEKVGVLMANSADCVAAFYAIALRRRGGGADQHPLSRGRAPVRHHERRAGGDHHQRQDRRLRRSARPDRKRPPRPRVRAGPVPPGARVRAGAQDRRRARRPVGSGDGRRAGPAGSRRRGERTRARSSPRGSSGARHRARAVHIRHDRPAAWLHPHARGARALLDERRPGVPADRRGPLLGALPAVPPGGGRAAPDVRGPRCGVHLGHVLRSDGRARADRARAGHDPVSGLPADHPGGAHAPGVRRHGRERGPRDAERRPARPPAPDAGRDARTSSSSRSTA